MALREADARIHEDLGEGAENFNALPVLWDERKPYHNLARDEDLVKAFVDDVLPIVNACRAERIDQERFWTRYGNMMLLKDDQPRYKGPIQVFLASGRKIVNTAATIIRQALFPEDDPYEVEADEGYEQHVESIRELSAYDMRQMEIKSKTKLIARTAATFGWCPMEHIWTERGDFRRVPKIYRGADSLTGQPTRRLGYDDVWHWDHRGPDLRVLSPFSTYVWPVQAPSIEEAQINFTDMLLSIDYLTTEAEGKRIFGLEDLKARGVKLESGNAYADNLSANRERTGGNEPTESGAKSSKDPIFYWVTDTECKIRIGDVRVSKPGDAGPKTEAEKREQDEREGGWVRFHVLHSGSVVLSITENPYWHKQSKRLIAHWEKMQDSIYGFGIADAIEDLSRYANAMLSLGLTNATMAECPITLIDPKARFKATSLRYAPFAKWMINPEQVKIVRPPADGGLGMQTTQFVFGMAQEMGGTPPILYGQAGGASVGEKTKFGLSLRSQNAQLPLVDVAEDMETEVHEPVMSRSYSMRQQFTSDEEHLQLTGKPKAKIPLEALLGEYRFSHLGSRRSQDFLRSAQHLGQFMEIGMKAGTKAIEVVEDGKQKYFQINVPRMLRKLYADALRGRDADKVVRDITEFVESEKTRQAATPPAMSPVPPGPGMQPNGTAGPPLSPAQIAAMAGARSNA